MPNFEMGWVNWLLIPAIAVGYGVIASGWNYLTRHRRERQHANDEYYDADQNRWY